MCEKNCQRQNTDLGFILFGRDNNVENGRCHPTGNREIGILNGSSTHQQFIDKRPAHSSRVSGLRQYPVDYLIAFFNILPVMFLRYGFVASLFDHLGLLSQSFPLRLRVRMRCNHGNCF